jgi:hypothetical protein
MLDYFSRYLLLRFVVLFAMCHSFLISKAERTLESSQRAKLPGLSANERALTQHGIIFCLPKRFTGSTKEKEKEPWL